MTGHIPESPRVAERMFAVIRYVEQRIKAKMVPLVWPDLPPSWGNVRPSWVYPERPDLVEAYLEVAPNYDIIEVRCLSAVSDDVDFPRSAAAWWALDHRNAFEPSLRFPDIDHVIDYWRTHSR